MTDLFEARQPAAPLAELMRPQTLDEVVGQQHLLGLRQAAARRHRVRQAALDDPVGAAGSGQDHAGAPDGESLRCRVHHLSAVLSGVKEIRDACRPRGERACSSPGARPSCSSTKCIASTRRSRMPFCRCRARPGHLHRRHDGKSIVRSHRGAAVPRRDVRPQAVKRGRTRRCCSTCTDAHALEIFPQ